MKQMNKSVRNIWVGRLLLAAVCLLMFSSCSPYAGINIGVPFKVGPVYVNPSIGVGGLL